VTDFSPVARARHWEALDRGVWDLLVVGGGITGAGVARDAAERGLRVALVEAGDFARGTSSRSSRLVHGGLRYLETGDFSLVFESLAERRRLLELAPHLVHPLPFLFPVHRGAPVGFRKLQAGMWLYDGLSLFRGLPRHRMLSAAGVLEAEPGLRSAGLRGGACYYDAAVDDARLTLAVARAAHEAGAALVPHAEVAGFLRDEAGVHGARVRDALGGGVREVRARVVVNATGPWCDAVRRLADRGVQPMLRLTRGVHLMLRRGRVGNRGAIIFRSPLDGRVMFILPWGEFTYLGTTDTDFAGDPGDAGTDAEDVVYLLASANHLFPEAGLVPHDVLSSWAGVRPLLAPAAERDGEVAESATSREHEVWRDPGGLVNVAGGKLTTYRVMAADAVDFTARILRDQGGREVPGSPTAHLPLPGAPLDGWEELSARVHAEAAALGIGPESAERLARAYGEEAGEVLAAVAREPSLGAPLVAGLPYLWGEVPHALRREMALTLEDLLRRRMHLFYEADDGGLGVARAVAERMAEHPGIGWSRAQVEAQVEAYRGEVKRTRGVGA
jgi:glycerol-3-phosphate dehydrogenase